MTQPIEKTELDKKYEKLKSCLKDLKKAAVALSGGVDSNFLSYAAREALGQQTLAVTLATPYIPQWEIRAARQFAETFNLRHKVIDLPFIEELRHNPPDHCYICKKFLFSNLIASARESGFTHILDGTHTDDASDDRPGIRALRELGVQSPLQALNFTKTEIRELSRILGLPTWDKPSGACLLSRIPVNTCVKDEELLRIEQSEALLMKLGFKAVRVRSHGEIARIEVPSDRIAALVAADRKHDIKGKLNAFGYHHVTVDLCGYHTGSLSRR